MRHLELRVLHVPLCSSRLPEYWLSGAETCRGFVLVMNCVLLSVFCFCYID